LNQPDAEGRVQETLSPRPKVVLLMTLGHLVNDLYATSLTPILPVLIQSFGLSMTQAGLLTTLRMASGQLAQPLYGFLGDRLGRRWFLGLGPLLTITIMGLAGWAPNYGVLVLFMVLAGVGAAAFHPQGAVVAGEASGRRRGLGMAVFLSGGILGAALAPWMTVPVVSRWGLRATLLAAVPGFVVGLFLWANERRLRLGRVARRRSWKLDFHGNGGALALLLLITAFRTIMESSMITFLPVLMQERGLSLMGGGVVFSLFLLFMAVASMVGGHLGDLVDPRRVISGALVLVTPLLHWSLRAQGVSMVVLWILSGMFLMASASLNTAMAQRLVPRDAGMASSLTMGVGLGLGAVGATLVGRLADAIGLIPAFVWLAWLPLFPAVLAFFLPRLPRPAPRAVPGEA